MTLSHKSSTYLAYSLSKYFANLLAFNVLRNTETLVIQKILFKFNSSNFMFIDVHKDELTIFSEGLKSITFMNYLETQILIFV